MNVAAGRGTAVFTWLQVNAGWSWASKEAVRAENSKREEDLENQQGGPANTGPLAWLESRSVTQRDMNYCFLKGPQTSPGLSHFQGTPSLREQSSGMSKNIQLVWGGSEHVQVQTPKSLSKKNIIKVFFLYGFYIFFCLLYYIYSILSLSLSLSLYIYIYIYTQCSLH